MYITKLRGMTACALLAAATAITAPAATVTWTDWASVTSGNPGSATGSVALSTPISVTYSGQTNGLSVNYPSWNPSTTFSGGAVDNAPPQSFNSVTLTGGTATVNTLTFSSAITNPVLAIWSLGAGGNPASFNFTSDEPFTIEAGGPSAEYGGASITKSGNNVVGSEASGIVMFEGTFSALTWTNPRFESYYVFTAGVAGPAGPSTVPEPSAFYIAGLGISALVLIRKRMTAR
jgi:hypothetical protein